MEIPSSSMVEQNKLYDIVPSYSISLWYIWFLSFRNYMETILVLKYAPPNPEEYNWKEE